MLFELTYFAYNANCVAQMTAVTPTVCKRSSIVPLRVVVDVARAGHKQFPGQFALPKAPTHAYSALCRRQGYERMLLARGSRKPVDPLPSACSYIRIACGSGIRIGVRQRRGLLLISCCKSFHGNPLYREGLKRNSLSDNETRK